MCSVLSCLCLPASSILSPRSFPPRSLPGQIGYRSAVIVSLLHLVPDRRSLYLLVT